jgi:hypothetical protein
MAGTATAANTTVIRTRLQAAKCSPEIDPGQPFAIEPLHRVVPLYMYAALRKKYRWNMRIGNFFWKLTGRCDGRTIIERVIEERVQTGFPYN